MNPSDNYLSPSFDRDIFLVSKAVLILNRTPLYEIIILQNIFSQYLRFSRKINLAHINKNLSECDVIGPEVPKATQIWWMCVIDLFRWVFLSGLAQEKWIFAASYISYLLKRFLSRFFQVWCRKYIKKKSFYSSVSKKSPGMNRCKCNVKNKTYFIRTVYLRMLLVWRGNKFLQKRNCFPQFIFVAFPAGAVMSGKLRKGPEELLFC